MKFFHANGGDRTGDGGTGRAGTDGAGAAGRAPAVVPDGAVREAYSFACMRCGHGWEQSYDIVHREYADGRPLIAYYADGVRVPSPLTQPACAFCDGHLVRIMRSGRVSAAEAALLPGQRHRAG